MRSRSAFPAFVSRYKDPNKLNLEEEAKSKSNLADLIDDVYENAVLVRQKYIPLGPKGKHGRDGNPTNKEAQHLVATWNNYVDAMKKLGAPDQVTGAASNHVKQGEELPHDYWINGEKCSRGDCVKVQVSSVDVGDPMEDITSHSGNEEENSERPAKSIKSDPGRAGAPGEQTVEASDAAQQPASSSRASEKPAPSSNAPQKSDSDAAQKPAASSSASEKPTASSSASEKPASSSNAPQKPAASSSASENPTTPDPKPASPNDPNSSASPGFSGRDDGTVKFNSPFAPISTPPGGNTDSTLHYWKELGGERHHIALGIHSERLGKATLTLYNLVARSSLLTRDEFEKSFKTEQNKFVFGPSERLTSNFDDLPIVALARVLVNCGDADRVYDPKKCFVGLRFESKVFWYRTKELELKYTHDTIADFYSQCWSFYSPDAITKDEYFEDQMATLRTPIPPPITNTVQNPAVASEKQSHAIAATQSPNQAREVSQGVPAQSTDASFDTDYSDEQLRQLQEYVTMVIAARAKTRKLDNGKGQAISTPKVPRQSALDGSK